MTAPAITEAELVEMRARGLNASFATAQDFAEAARASLADIPRLITEVRRQAKEIALLRKTPVNFRCCADGCTGVRANAEGAFCQGCINAGML